MKTRKSQENVGDARAFQESKMRLSVPIRAISEIDKSAVKLSFVEIELNKRYS
jgi:hypothetical protein